MASVSGKISSGRWREVGKHVRGGTTAIGATRSQLIAQFLGESLPLTAIAARWQVAIVVAALPPFGAFVETNIGLAYLTAPEAVSLLVVLTLVVELVAGSYPAFFLSAFKPMPVLKGEVTHGQRRGGVSQGARRRAVH